MSEHIPSAAGWTDDRDAWMGVAISFQGLKALGVPESSLSSFPLPFQQGMAGRAEQLRDVGTNAPEHWDQSFQPGTCHIALTIYARDEAALKVALDQAMDEMEHSSGVTLVGQHAFGADADAKNPFGFRDSISQPFVAGSGVEPLAGQERAITAEAERSRIETAISSGVSDLLVKPYTAGRLAISIKRAMAHQVAPPVPDTNIDAPLVAVTVDGGIMPPAAVHLPPPQPLPPTLLLVDDTADNLYVLANLFKGRYRIKAAHNGEKALSLCCSDTPPDLVLLDVMMPGMDGFEVARRMRQHPGAENVPIIFVTALTDDAATRRSA